MTLFQIIAILITLAAALSYVNHRFLRLPTTIGLMVLSLALSLVVVFAGMVHEPVRETARQLLEQIDFSEALLHGMLGALLFAGALHIDLGDLAEQKRIIAILATGGVIVSTVLVAGFVWLIARLVGIEMQPIHCLLFGALISPTDPIAVLGLLKSLGAPRSLATKIAGESLFNDGVGVVVFLALLGFAGAGHGEHGPSAMTLLNLFVVEVGGGVLFGLAVGMLAFWLLRSINQYQVEILITLAIVTGGYALADALHLSGPIAMVVAGLLIGNHGRILAMNDTTREHLDMFWELVDEILNAVLFVLIGLEVLVLTFEAKYLLAGLLAIPATLVARFIAVGGGITTLRRIRTFTPHVIKAMTWGGLRGGISVSLALSIRTLFDPAQASTRDVLLMMTYVVVVFSIVVQGLTIGGLMRRWGLTGK
jgi:CPA1 family monovalent cation:H+ antiporter